MITYNGNEMMLQNDMGNTLIQDSKTGHIMGLSEGFIPVGLKEHGGIMYIASVNKEGKGEIGTIPSPILTLSQNYPNDVESRNAILVHNSGPDHNLTILSDYKIAPGEKFLIGLNLKVDQQKTWYYKPMITCFNGNTLVRGMYNIKLYTVYDTNSVCLDKLISTPQKYCTTDGKLNTSNYWFISSDLTTNIDINKTYIAKEFKTYPGNIPAGRLAIKVELENIDSFSLMKSIQTQGVNAGEATLAPRVTKNSDGEYILDFPGFDYKTSSARFVGKVEYCLYDQKTKQPLYNTNKQQNGEIQVDENSTFKIIDRETLEEHYHIRRTTDPIIPQPALFSYNIGKALNNWYQIVVTYYDQFGGKIDTYKYSFNPYHVLTLEENYSLGWKPGLEYEQIYDWDKTDFYADSVTKLTVTPKKSYSQYKTKIQEWGRSASAYSYSDTGSGALVQNFALTLNSGDLLEKSKDNLNINGSIDSFNLRYLYKPRTTNVYIDPFKKIEWMFDSSSADTVENCVINTSDLTNFRFTLKSYSFSSWKGEPEELSLYDASGNDISDNYTTSATSDSPKIYVGQMNTESKFEYNLVNDYDFGLTNNGIEVVSWSNKIEKGNESLQGAIGISVALTANDSPKITVDPLLYSSTADYTIISNFSLYGDSDTKFNMAMGLDRNGHPQPAWTFGKSLLTFVDLQPTSDHASFVKTVEYLPETKSITQIIYPGTYLLNLNAYSDTGSVAITIDNENPVDVEIKERYFAPQLIYVSKDTKLTLSWSGIKKLRNIGLYQLSKPVWNTDRTQFGENKVYDIKAYQDDALDVKSEVIIPLQASYYEKASCYGRNYDYYTGPVEAYMTDRHKLANGTVLSFVYTWNENDATKAQVGAIPDQLEEMSTLTYRNEKQ